MKGCIRFTDTEIAEMAKAMGDFELKDTAKCDIELSEHLFAKGYRKQSDTVREILQKLIYNITANNTNDGYLSESIDYSSTIDDIKELAAQYGVEAENEVQR